MGVGEQRHAPGCITCEKDVWSPLCRRVTPRAVLDGCGKLDPPPIGIRSPDRPARCESLTDYAILTSFLIYTQQNYLFILSRTLLRIIWWGNAMHTCEYICAFPSFFVWPLLPTHSRCRGLLYLITLIDVHTLGMTPLGEGSVRRGGLYLYNTIFTRDGLPCLLWEEWISRDTPFMCRYRA
jgi:hypothetical protein